MRTAAEAATIMADLNEFQGLVGEFQMSTTTYGAVVRHPDTTIVINKSTLRQRTAELLSREIGFIDNPIFRQMEASQAVEPRLPLNAIATLPSHVVKEMPAHITRMCEAPLLTPAEETRLFTWMNYYRYRANALRTTLSIERPSATKLKKIEDWIARADLIRNHIVRANTRLVISIVKPLADERNPFDELLSEGTVCLMRVVDKFNFERGFRFSTYATSAVRRELWRLVQRNHRDRQRYATGNEQLDAHAGKDLGNPMDEATWRRIGRKLNRILAQLDDREAFIVQERFGLGTGGRKRTFQSLGDELGVCKERVRQLEIRAMKKLEEFARDASLHLLVSE